MRGTSEDFRPSTTTILTESGPPGMMLAICVQYWQLHIWSSLLKIFMVQCVLFLPCQLLSIHLSIYLSTKITEVNLFALAYKLFHEDFSNLL